MRLRYKRRSSLPGSLPGSFLGPGGAGGWASSLFYSMLLYAILVWSILFYDIWSRISQRIKDQRQHQPHLFYEPWGQWSTDPISRWPNDCWANGPVTVVPMTQWPLGQWPNDPWANESVTLGPTTQSATLLIFCSMRFQIIPLYCLYSILADPIRVSYPIQFSTTVFYSRGL